MKGLVGESPRIVDAGRWALGRLTAAGTLLASLALACVGLAGLALTPEPAVAQAADGDRGQAETSPPLVGDRPDFTESASAVTRFQLETGYTFSGADDVDVHTLGEALLRIPAAEGLELRVEVSSYEWEEISGATAPSETESSGFTDPSLGLKLELLEPSDAEPGPSVALLAWSTLPTRDVSDAGAQPGAALAAEADLSDRLSLGVNAGVEGRDAADVRFTELSGSVALGIGLTESVGAYAEGYGFVPTGDGPDASSVVNGGLTLLVTPDLQLDARIGAGLSGPAPDVLAGAGVVWRP